MSVEDEVRLRLENARLHTALAQAEQRRTALEAGFQDQVHNALALIHSVVRGTSPTGDGLEGYNEHLEGRLGAIGRTLRLTVRSGGETEIGLDFLLAEELLAEGAREGEHADLSGPPVQLCGAAIGSLGLAFHELAVNSVKFGALSDPEGRIAVTWRIECEDDGVEPAVCGPGGGANDGPSRTLWLDWVETGPPHPEAATRRRGFGTELIERALAHDLGAEAALNVTPSGVRCTITLPVRDDILRIDANP